MSNSINYIGNLPFSDDSDSDNSQEKSTAQENPATDIATTSTQGIPIDDTFFCELKEARVLKFAIEALCDPVSNNKQGLGRIDVDVNGFNVTVENKDRNVVGHLFLKPSKFGCIKPIEGMVVNLPQLYQTLTRFNDDGPLTIFQDNGINRLYFCTVGTSPFVDMFFVELLENQAAIPKFPELSSLFCASVPSKDLRLMLDHLLQQAPYEAIVEMVENTATLKTVHENRVIGQYPMFVGVEPGAGYRASFEWTRAEWLNKARDLTVLAVGHTEQPTYIVWRFHLTNLGEGEYQLEYVKEPINIP